MAVLNHNKPTAYLVPAVTYEWIQNLLEDRELGDIVKQREAEKHQAVEISLDEL